MNNVNQTILPPEASAEAPNSSHKSLTMVLAAAASLQGHRADGGSGGRKPGSSLRTLSPAALILTEAEGGMKSQ
jgi:hypothetical protein